MTPFFVGVNEKFINLQSIALVEDETTEEGESIAKITTTDGAEIELTGTDADVLFDQVELFARATDELVSRLVQGAIPPQ